MHLKRKTPAEFLHDARRMLCESCDPTSLHFLQGNLSAQCLLGMQNRKNSMLPSYTHRLPTGHETGSYFALDMGGSTFRVAMVLLHGPGEGEDRDVQDRCSIVHMDVYPIDDEIRQLQGKSFFSWMAQCIQTTLASTPKETLPSTAMPIALAWSFPIEQTSVHGGNLQPMGKCFRGSDGVVGQDLGRLIETACHDIGLHVHVRAIVNDASACLLSQVYLRPSIRLSVILGTGFNIAAFLPVDAIGTDKFGDRPAEWWRAAQQVVVNTEISMYGKGVLPDTRWDLQLRSTHAQPDFQPLEQMVSGMYLGEICRLALVEAAELANICGGRLPPSLYEPYSLTTQTLAEIVGDTSMEFSKARQLLSTLHPSEKELSFKDIFVIKTLAKFVARRSSAVIAAAIYALWRIRTDFLVPDSIQDNFSLHGAETQAGGDVSTGKQELTTVSVSGSVVEKFPGFLENCQRSLDDLMATESKGTKSSGRIYLVKAEESSILGAAVALACLP